MIGERWSRVALAAACAMFGLIAPGSAQSPAAAARPAQTSPKAAVDEVWARYFAATTDATRDAAIARLVSAGITPQDALARLRRGPTFAADAPTGWRTLSIRGSDGVDRPQLAWIPRDYDPTRSYTMIVDLHGAVSRTSWMTDEYLTNLKYRAGKLAETEGALLLIPKGKRGAEWWTPLGAANVLAGVRRLKREYRVDDDRVFCVGFSDGGSGSFYLALHHASTFAGFVPMCGHVQVAQAGGDDVFLRNLRNRPLYVINTGRDVLYPSAQVRPFIATMKQAGIDVTFRSFDEMPHAPLFAETERPRIWAWMNAHPRPASPAELWLETAKCTAVDWIAIEVLAPASAAWLEDLNPDVRYLLRRAGIERDRRRLPVAELRISAPAAVREKGSDR